MQHSFSVSGFFVSACALGFAAASQNTTSKLQWETCREQSDLQCATLAVPRDYQCNNNETIVLNLVRSMALTQPSKGSVLYNPGGPGDSGRNGLVAALPLFQLYTGGLYDLISWDTRGTGSTLPASCFANDTARQLLYSQIPDVTPSNEKSITEAWNWASSVASACKTGLADMGDLIGSAYSARDMAEIVEALDEDGLLRYYGASYGSALGQIFAAMFPEKVDKIVIDGILNPHQYITGDDFQQVADSEAVLDGFVTACMSRPELCSMARRDTSVKSIRQQIDDAFDQLEAHPFAYGHNASSRLTSWVFRSTIHSTLYSPILWPLLANFTNAVLSRNMQDTQSYLSQLQTPAETTFAYVQNPEMTPAIRCSDVTSRLANASEAVPIVKTFEAQSSHFGGYLAGLQYPVICGQWPYKAKEQYTGNFDVQTKNPMLIVGNVFDPITSLDAARNASNTFNGSRLLVHEGYGHTSQGQPAPCTRQAIAAYFVNGTLPPEGTICRPTIPIFATEAEWDGKA